MAERTIKDSQNELKKIKHHINWDDIEVNRIYHIPPIITIERMDILITEKDEKDGKIKFQRIDSTTDVSEKAMHSSSILARFLVKKKRY
jgi:hypothetical protein